MGWAWGRGPFAAAPFGIRRFKPILPFLGGRSDAACRVVMKTVGLMVGGAGGGGRGNLRVAKTPPLQSAFAGMPLRVALRSRCCHCRRLHARAMPPMENHVFITEAEWEGRALGGGRVRGGGRTRGGGRATFGPPLQHRPYRECNGGMQDFYRKPPKRQGKPCSFKHIRGEE